ncbi:MAG TPA: DNA internalization-related competence protein ComEC/Rec2 [Balneolaceae bacterium]
MVSLKTYRFPFASYPAIRLALLFAAGIIIDYHFKIPAKLWIAIFALSVILYFSGEIIHQKRLKTRAYHLAIAGYLLGVMAFGGAWHSIFNHQKVPIEGQVINKYTWQELTFIGEVYEIKESSSGNFQIDVRVDTTIFKTIPWPKTYNLRVVLNPNDLALPANLDLGDRMKFTATVYPLKGQRNPNEFSYKNYLASKEIYVQAGVKSILDITNDPSFWRWTFFRQKVLDVIENNFSEETAPLAKALLIGYKNELGLETKTAFSRAGLSHIMAVSGLHVGFLLAPFWLLIPFFWTLKYGRQIGLVFLITLLFFYAGLTGFSASVMRASLAGGFLMYGRLFHKIRDSKNLMAVAALIILLINPGDLFSISFQLSFAAVYIILLIAPVIFRRLPNWIQFRWYGAPVSAIIISFIVQLGLFPMLAWYFGEFSIVGPLANAIVLPFLGLVVPYALILLPFGMIFPETAQLLNLPVNWFFSGLNWFVRFTSGWEWSWMQAHIEGLMFFAIWVAAIFFIAALPVPKIRWKFFAVFLLVLCVEQAHKLTQKLQSPTLKVTVFDVGQGDAALIKTPLGKHFLVDAGRWQPGYNSGKYVLIPHLKSLGIEKLDAVFLSHPHADHIGGMVELVQTIPIDTIYSSGMNYDSDLFKTYRRAAAQKQIPIVDLRAGDRVSIDPSIRLFVYGPGSNSSSNINNHSLIFELVYGSTEFLFMGDAEALQERQLIANYPEWVNTDFLKVGHHGSRTSSNMLFLRQSTPEIATVSLAKSNRFRHPNQEAIRRLRAAGAGLHFTSLEGALIFESDGKIITQIEWR